MRLKNYCDSVNHEFDTLIQNIVDNIVSIDGRFSEEQIKKLHSDIAVYLNDRIRNRNTSTLDATPKRLN